MRLGKAHSTFGRLFNIWNKKSLSVKNKFRLYETLILSTLLYGSETWPITVANMKRLEAAHHKWQRKILGISWKDMVKNEDVRRRSGQALLEDTIRQRRLRQGRLSPLSGGSQLPPNPHSPPRWSLYKPPSPPPPTPTPHPPPPDGPRVHVLYLSQVGVIKAPR